MSLLMKKSVLICANLCPKNNLQSVHASPHRSILAYVAEVTPAKSTTSTLQHSNTPALYYSNLTFVAETFSAE